MIAGVLYDFILLAFLIYHSLMQEKHVMEIPTKNPGVCSVKILASFGVAAAGIAIASSIYVMRKRWPG